MFTLFGFVVPETIIYAVVTWFLMLAAFMSARRYRRLHVVTMGTVITLDFLFPFYLYATRDWGRRLFDEGEILSFMLWTHLLLVLTLYVLYVVQIQAGSRLLKGVESARADHRAQGLGILVTRALVIFTGALFIESP
ncbi:MAG: hypothetical protein RBT81_06625 [Gammaproteobacteria bacterium]|jgi:hypothetical protein|nr:hypothetical protein [Gammaproteobacteria bacterium]